MRPCLSFGYLGRRPGLAAGLTGPVGRRGLGGGCPADIRNSPGWPSLDRGQESVSWPSSQAGSIGHPRAGAHSMTSRLRLRFAAVSGEESGEDEGKPVTERIRIALLRGALILAACMVACAGAGIGAFSAPAKAASKPAARPKAPVLSLIHI